MSEFEREDQEVFSLVRQNRRRSGITETVGYIVPEKDVREFVAYRAGRQRGGETLMIGIIALALLVGVLAAVLV